MERSGLAEHTELHGHVLELAQAPLAAYVFPIVGVMVALSMASGLMPALIPLAALSFVFMVGALIAMGLFRPTVRIELTPHAVRVEGWVGALPRPAAHTVPVVGTELKWRRGSEMNEVQLFVVRLEHPDGKLVLPSVRCTERELEAVQARLEDMQRLAERRHGEGADEVPAGLRELASRRPESE